MSPSDWILKKYHEVADNPIIPNQVQDCWFPGNPKFLAFEIGQKVLKKTVLPGNLTTNKLKNRYSGPYKVIKINSNGVSYVLETPTKEIPAHHSQLKL